MAIDASRLALDLIRDEGVRLKLYPDTKGKLTIGVGRNLTDIGISRDEAQVLLNNDMARVLQECARFGWWGALNEPRQRAIANMAFNLGLDGFRSFRKLNAALTAGDYHTAAVEMLDSQWASQVGARADRLASMMDSGQSLIT